jgi:tyrosine-protein phosphatase YwqE
MLSLFKPKYKLSELIPENFIDIHNHLLPNIDDGAKSLDETTFLIEKMKALNIKNAIATPHTFDGYYNNTKQSIQEAYELATSIYENANFIKGFSSEYMLDDSLIKRAEKESLLCIKDNFILIELSFLSPPINLFELLFELKLKDYQIVLAHPERYLYYHNSFKTFQILKDYEIDLQVNLLSFTGYYGIEIKKTAEKLLEADLLDFCGTDIHNINHINAMETKVKNANKLEEILKKNSFFK